MTNLSDRREMSIVQYIRVSGTYPSVLCTGEDQHKTLQFAHQIAHQFTHQIAHQRSRRYCTTTYTKVDEQFDEQFDE